MAAAMRHRSITIRLVAACLLGALPGQHSQAAPAVGWRLEQQSDYSGRQTMIVSPAGIRADSLDYTTIVVPPAYRAMLYNHRTRQYFFTSARQLSDKFRLKPESVYDVVPGSSQTIAGLKAKQYFGYKKAAGRSGRPKIEFWVTDDLRVPDKAYQYWSDLSRIPRGYGLPLRVIKYRADGSKLLLFDTSYCRRITVTPGTFQGPSGYKLVNSELQLILGE